MAIVDFETAKAHCKIDGAYEDSILQIYFGAAKRSAAAYLNRTIYDDQAALDAALVIDPEDTGIAANDTINAAILLTTAHLYVNREAVDTVQKQELPLGVIHLLQPDRIGMGV